MTMREVDISLRMMHVRKHNAHAARAALHGIQMKTITRGVEVKPLDPKKEALANQILERAIREKRKEYGNK